MCAQYLLVMYTCLTLCCFKLPLLLGEDLMSSGDVLESPDSPEHQPLPQPVQDPAVPEITETAMDSNPGSPLEDTGTSR